MISNYFFLIVQFFLTVKFLICQGVSDQGKIFWLFIAKLAMFFGHFGVVIAKIKNPYKIVHSQQQTSIVHFFDKREVKVYL